MERLRVFLIGRRVWLSAVGAAVVAGAVVWHFVGTRQDRARLVFRPAPPVSVHERAGELDILLFLMMTVGLLLGTAVGDAKGLPYETLTKEQIAQAPAPPPNQPYASFFASGQMFPAFPVGTPPGRYSDDTQLSVAIISALLKAEKFDMQALVEAHIAAYDERINGWGGGTKKAIEKLKQGVPPTQAGTKDTSGNGVIIKLAPLCLWYALKSTPAAQVSIEVEALTRLTHDNPYCVVVALLHARCLIRVFINGSNNADYYQSTEARLRFLTDAIKDAEELERQFSIPDSQKISTRLNNLRLNINDLTDTRILEISSGGTSNCAHSLTLVYGLFVARAPSFTTVLKAAFIGGDTDSNAAMLGAMIGGIKGVRFIPPHYIEHVERGSELVDLAGRFALMFMN